ncbi:MAG: ABC transporter ATP-binding protein, partial [Burkholderiales bacterium 12-64-5]
MLHLSNIRAAYGQVAALHGIDMEIHAGEVVALIGSNGAGKSTTLKVLSGLVQPTAGKLEFLGQSLIGLRP